MADRAIKGVEKDTKVEDEMIAGDEDGNDEVTFAPLETRQWAYIIFRKKYLR
jgi:hypothetical protein